MTTKEQKNKRNEEQLVTRLVEKLYAREEFIRETEKNSITLASTEQVRSGVFLPELSLDMLIALDNRIAQAESEADDNHRL